MGSIITLSGARGVGKSTIAREILREKSYARMLANVTTRPPQQGDPPGVYRHLSEAQFHTKKMGGHFTWTADSEGFRYGVEGIELINALKGQAFRWIAIAPPYAVSALMDEVERRGELMAGGAMARIWCFFIRVCEEKHRERLKNCGATPATAERLIREGKELEEQVQEHLSHLPLIMITNEGPIREVVEEILSYCH